MRYIAHIGVGNFHRSHQADYLQRLNHVSESEQWGIIGISLMPQDETLLSLMKSQDYRYHLLKRAPDGGEVIDEITVIKDIIPAFKAYDQAIACLAAQTTEIISFTITEGAYLFDQKNHQLNWDHPSLQHDAENTAQPKTIFGYLYQALSQRRASHGLGVTLMTCDNVQHNGLILQQSLMQFLNKVDSDLAQWVEAEVRFPSTMVDRITPASNPVNSDYLKETQNIEDVVPVVSEAFGQWVVEDSFRFERPSLDKVGVIYTSDVTVFEDMKIKLLNGGHSCLAYIASLAGYEYVHEAIGDEQLHAFVKAYMSLDARPCLQGTPGVDTGEYIDILLARFSNVAIADVVERLCGDGLSKLTNFLSDVTKQAIAAGRPLDRLATIYAAYHLYLARGVEQSEAYPLVEPQADAALLQQCSTDIPALLSELSVGDTPALTALVEAKVASIREQGMMATIAAEIARDD